MAFEIKIGAKLVPPTKKEIEAQVKEFIKTAGNIENEPIKLNINYAANVSDLSKADLEKLAESTNKILGEVSKAFAKEFGTKISGILDQMKLDLTDLSGSITQLKDSFSSPDFLKAIEKFQQIANTNISNKIVKEAEKISTATSNATNAVEGLNTELKRQEKNNNASQAKKRDNLKYYDLLIAKLEELHKYHKMPELLGDEYVQSDAYAKTNRTGDRTQDLKSKAQAKHKEYEDALKQIEEARVLQVKLSSELDSLAKKNNLSDKEIERKSSIAEQLKDLPKTAKKLSIESKDHLVDAANYDALYYVRTKEHALEDSVMPSVYQEIDKIWKKHEKELREQYKKYATGSDVLATNKKALADGSKQLKKAKFGDSSSITMEIIPYLNPQVFEDFLQDIITKASNRLSEIPVGIKPKKDAVKTGISELNSLLKQEEDVSVEIIPSFEKFKEETDKVVTYVRNQIEEAFKNLTINVDPSFIAQVSNVGTGSGVASNASPISSPTAQVVVNASNEQVIATEKIDDAKEEIINKDKNILALEQKIKREQEGLVQLNEELSNLKNKKRNEQDELLYQQAQSQVRVVEKAIKEDTESLITLQNQLNKAKTKTDDQVKREKEIEDTKLVSQALDTVIKLKEKENKTEEEKIALLAIEQKLREDKIISSKSPKSDEKFLEYLKAKKDQNDTKVSSLVAKNNKTNAQNARLEKRQSEDAIKNLSEYNQKVTTYQENLRELIELQKLPAESYLDGTRIELRTPDENKRIKELERQNSTLGKQIALYSELNNLSDQYNRNSSSNNFLNESNVGKLTNEAIDSKIVELRTTAESLRKETNLLETGIDKFEATARVEAENSVKNSLAQLVIEKNNIEKEIKELEDAISKADVTKKHALNKRLENSKKSLERVENNTYLYQKNGYTELRVDELTKSAVKGYQQQIAFKKDDIKHSESLIVALENEKKQRESNLELAKQQAEADRRKNNPTLKELNEDEKNSKKAYKDSINNQNATIAESESKLKETVEASLSLIEEKKRKLDEEKAELEQIKATYDSIGGEVVNEIKSTQELVNIKEQLLAKEREKLAVLEKIKQLELSPYGNNASTTLKAKEAELDKISFLSPEEIKKQVLDNASKRIGGSQLSEKQMSDILFEEQDKVDTSERAKLNRYENIINEIKTIKKSAEETQTKLVQTYSELETITKDIVGLNSQLNTSINNTEIETASNYYKKAQTLLKQYVELNKQYGAIADKKSPDAMAIRSQMDELPMQIADSYNQYSKLEDQRNRKRLSLRSGSNIYDSELKEVQATAKEKEYDQIIQQGNQDLRLRSHIMGQINEVLTGTIAEKSQEIKKTEEGIALEEKRIQRAKEQHALALKNADLSKANAKKQLDSSLSEIKNKKDKLNGIDDTLVPEKEVVQQEIKLEEQLKEQIVETTDALNKQNDIRKEIQEQSKSDIVNINESQFEKLLTSLNSLADILNVIKTSVRDVATVFNKSTVTIGQGIDSVTGNASSAAKSVKLLGNSMSAIDLFGLNNGGAEGIVDDLKEQILRALEQDESIQGAMDLRISQATFKGKPAVGDKPATEDKNLIQIAGKFRDATGALVKFSGEYDRVQEQMFNISFVEKEIANNLSRETDLRKKAQKALEGYNQSFQKINWKQQEDWLNVDGILSDQKKLETLTNSQIKLLVELSNLYDKLEANIKEFNSSGEAMSEKQQAEMTQLINQISTMQQRAYSDVVMTVEKDAQKFIASYKESIRKITSDNINISKIKPETLSKEGLNKLELYQNSYRSLLDLEKEYNMQQKYFTENQKTRMSNLIDEVREYKSLLGKGASQVYVSGQGTKIDKLSPNISDVNKLRNALTGLIQTEGLRNLKIDTEIKKENQLNYTYRDQQGYLVKASLLYNRLNGDVSQMIKSSTKFKNVFSNISDTFKQKFVEIFRYLSAYEIIYSAFYQIKQGVSIIKEIDDALTELKKVTDSTEAEYRKFIKTSTDISKAIGSTTSQIITSASMWAKLNYTLKESAELAKNTAIYMNVADIDDITLATEYLTSTLKAFNIDAMDSIKIVDSFNEIGNNFGITSEGLGEALERSAASLVAAGVDFNQAVGLIAAGNLISQDAESVGNTLKVMSLRVRGSSTELEKMGEDTDGLATSTSKLRAELKALTGVDIMKDANTFKDTYEMLLEISKVFNNLSDVSQANVLEKLAGKTRASVVAGLLQNMNVAEEAMAASANSAGSAIKENEKQLNSITGRITLFKAQAQEMWSHFIDSDIVKYLIDIGTQLVAILDKIGLARSLFGSLGLVILIKNFGKLSSALKKMQEFSVIAQAAKTLTIQFDAQQLALKGLSTSQIAYILQLEGMDAAQIQAALTSAGLSSANVGLTGTFTALGTSIKLAFSQLLLFLQTNPIGWIIDIVAVVGLLVGAFDLATKSQKELQKQAEKSAQALADTQTEIESINSELKTTGDRIDELLKKQNLTFVEKDELEQLQKSNDELERELRIKEQLKKQQEATASSDTYKSIINQDEKPLDHPVTGNIGGQFNVSQWFFNNFYGKNTSLDSDLNRLDAIYERLDKLKTLNQEIINIQNKQGTTSDKTEWNKLDQQIKDKKKIVSEYEKYINETAIELMSEDDTLVKGINNKTDELIDNLGTLYETVDSYFNTSGETTEKNINGVANKKEFSGVVDSLVQAIKTGKTFESEFNNVKFDGLRKALEDAKIDVNDFYTYIMSKANPDALNTKYLGKKVVEKIKQDKLSQGDFIQHANDAANTWLSRQTDDAIEIAYGIVEDTDTSTWSFEDWDHEIEKRKNLKLTVGTDIVNFLTDGSEDNDFISTVDKYQTKISSLNEALEKLRSGNLGSNEIYELMKEFPVLAKYTDNLEGGLEHLMDTAKDNAIGLLDDAIEKTEDPKAIEFFKYMKNVIADMSTEAEASATSFTTLSDALSALKNGNGIIKDMQSDMKDLKYVSSDTLSSIMQQYSELGGEVAQYIAGSISYDDLLADVKEAYDEDYRAYARLILDKTKLDTDFFSTVISKLDEHIKKQADQYGIDLTNYADYVKSKADIDAVYLARLNTIMAIPSDGMSLTGESPYVQFMKEYTQMQSAFADIDKAIEESVAGVLGGYKGTDSSSKTKEFTGEIDWLEQSLSNLEDAVNDAQRKFENTEGYQAQIDALNELLSKQNDLRQGYNSAANAYKTRYNTLMENPSLAKYRSAIEGGANFTLESFNGNEDLYNSVVEAQNVYKKSRENLDQIDVTEKSILDKEKERYKISESYYDNLIGWKKRQKQDILNAIEENNGQGTVAQYNALKALDDEEKKYWEKKKRNAEEAQKGTYKNSFAYYEFAVVIQECEDAISEITVSQNELNASILQLPITTLEEANDALKDQVDILNETRDSYDKIINAVIGYLDDEISKLEESKKTKDKYYDDELKRKQDDLEAFKKTNEERQKQIEYEKALYNQQKALNQKTNRVYREGQGFVYEADTDAVKDAQDTLDSLAYDKIIDGKQAEIDALEKEKESWEKSFDSEIERLTDIKETWQDISDIFDKMKEFSLADLYFGGDWGSRLKSGDTSDIAKMINDYTVSDAAIDAGETQIETNEKVIKSLQKYAEAWYKSGISIDEAYTYIQDTVNNTLAETNSTQDRIDKTASYSKQWNKTKDSISSTFSQLNIDHALAAVQEGMLLDSRIVKLKEFVAQYNNELSKLNSSSGMSIGSGISAGAGAGASTGNRNNLITGKSILGIGAMISAFSAIAKHSGIESGLIGSSTSNSNAKRFEMITLDKLAPDEIPAVLLKGEAVLTQLQQGNALSNVASAFKAGASLSSGAIQSKSAKPVSFSIGEIHLHEVQNVDTLSREIVHNFLPTLKQQLFK